MPRHQGIQWTQWYKCDRCSFTWPIGAIVVQLGLKLCPRCVDNLDVMTRPKLIADILTDGQEQDDDRVNLSIDPGISELEF